MLFSQFLKPINALPTGPGSLHDPPTDEKVHPSSATAEVPTGCSFAAAAVPDPANTPTATPPANTTLPIPRFTLLFDVLIRTKLPHRIAKPFAPQHPPNSGVSRHST